MNSPAREYQSVVSVSPDECSCSLFCAELELVLQQAFRFPSVSRFTLGTQVNPQVISTWRSAGQSPPRA